MIAISNIIITPASVTFVICRICLVSRRVIIADRVIVHERVAVPGLRPLRGGGDDGVRGGETSQRGVEPASYEEVKSQAGFLALTGELVVRAERGRCTAQFAKGFVQRGGADRPVGVRGEGGAAEACPERSRRAVAEPVEAWSARRIIPLRIGLAFLLQQQIVRRVGRGNFQADS